MKTAVYKGVELENLDKKVSMAHTVFLECDEGTDWLIRLYNYNKNALTPEQFQDASALSSVVNMNYMICNSGLSGYYQNAYHTYHAPFTEQDLARLDKEAQEEMLRELVEFAIEVFPEQGTDAARLALVISDFVASSYEEPECDDKDEDEDECCEDGLCASDGFDEAYYEVNDFLEQLLESYAQYLVKSFELD